VEEEEKGFSCVGFKNSSRGGGCLERDRVRFRVWVFYVFFKCAKLPPLLCVC